MLSGLVSGVAIAALCLSVLTLIAMMGILRELVTLQGHVFGPADVAAAPHPHQPPYMGSAIPVELSSALCRYDQTLADRSFTLLFLSGDCGSCRHLLKALRETVNDSMRASLSKHLLVITTDADQQARSDLQALKIGALSTDDDSARLFAVASVSATPSALHVANPGFVAEHHEIGADIEWLTGLLEFQTKDAGTRAQV